MSKRTLPSNLQPEPHSARVILDLVVTGGRLSLGNAVAVDMDVIPANPYDDVWNNQPWFGHRKKTKHQVIDALPTTTIDMNCEQLRAALKEKGLPINGNKEQLVERLMKPKPCAGGICKKPAPTPDCSWLESFLTPPSR